MQSIPVYLTAILKLQARLIITLSNLCGLPALSTAKIRPIRAAATQNFNLIFIYAFCLLGVESSSVQRGPRLVNSKRAVRIWCDGLFSDCGHRWFPRHTKSLQPGLTKPAFIKECHTLLTMNKLRISKLISTHRFPVPVAVIFTRRQQMHQVRLFWIPQPCWRDRKLSGFFLALIDNCFTN